MHLEASYPNGADALAFAHQRYHQDSTVAETSRVVLRLRKGISLRSQKVVDVDRLLFDNAMASSPFPIDRQADLAHGDRSRVRTIIQVVAVLEPDNGVVASAEFAGALDDRPKHRSNIGRRGGNHPEN